MFGRLVKGMEVLRKLEKTDTSRDDCPLKKVTISECGEHSEEAAPSASAPAPASSAPTSTSASSAAALLPASASSATAPPPLSPRSHKRLEEEERKRLAEAKEAADEQELKKIVASDTASDRAKRLAELKMKLVSPNPPPPSTHYMARSLDLLQGLLVSSCFPFFC